MHKLRIIAGKFKNKKILSPSMDTTRSSKNFLRESFFSIMQFEVINSTFIELFAGSGSMGIEAISRGAKNAIFFEKDKSAFDTLKKNIKLLEIDNYEAYNGDSFEISFDKIKNLRTNTILYIDPPFHIRDKMSNIYDKTINLISKINNPYIKNIIIEHSSEASLNQAILCYNLVKLKKYGKSSLSFYELKDNNE
jgi:16S rRNA (guanine(966)-N(2))-methyltransferase RsmD